MPQFPSNMGQALTGMLSSWGNAGPQASQMVWGNTNLGTRKINPTVTPTSVPNQSPLPQLSKIPSPPTAGAPQMYQGSQLGGTQRLPTQGQPTVTGNVLGGATTPLSAPGSAPTATTTQTRGLTGNVQGPPVNTTAVQPGITQMAAPQGQFSPAGHQITHQFQIPAGMSMDQIRQYIQNMRSQMQQQRPQMPQFQGMQFPQFQGTQFQMPQWGQMQMPQFNLMQMAQQYAPQIQAFQNALAQYAPMLQQMRSRMPGQGVV